ncbi:hypothetical protein RRG08_034084 [Elysia crispata]|uniref:Uncharacterized protein n=1 Tax=Elysia crispata TaxID=231223 RepID=A0AAE0YSG6_9GAST|nr:hypothetical protein RRG08_034084 [Elysia crispata]
MLKSLSQPCVKHCSAGGQSILMESRCFHTLVVNTYLYGSCWSLACPFVQEKLCSVGSSHARTNRRDGSTRHKNPASIRGISMMMKMIMKGGLPGLHPIPGLPRLRHEQLGPSVGGVILAKSSARNAITLLPLDQGATFRVISETLLFDRVVCEGSAGSNS